MVTRRTLLTGLAALLLAPPDLDPRRKLWALGGLPVPDALYDGVFARGTIWVGSAWGTPGLWLPGNGTGGQTFWISSFWAGSQDRRARVSYTHTHDAQGRLVHGEVREDGPGSLLAQFDVEKNLWMPVATGVGVTLPGGERWVPGMTLPEPA